MAWNVYSELIHNGFAILDRLSLELQHDGRPTTTFSQRYPMLSVPVWSAPLLAWRDYLFVRIHHHHQQQPTNHLAGEEEFGSSFFHTDSDGAWIHDNDMSEARFLDPFVMLSRMEDYQNVGLVEPHPCLYSIVLHALEKTTTVQRQQQQHRMGSNGGADPCPYHRAHVEIYETMLHRSQGNPNHAQYHPDSSTMYHLIALWSHSGLPQAPERAEFYFQALEDWYRHCPHRSALRPTPLVYCALMETYSRHTYRSSALSSNDEDSGSTGVHTHTAFHRIQELYTELHQVFAPHELQAVTYNRACHAVAQCRHAHSATAARAILDQQCQRYLNDSASSTTIRQSSSSSSSLAPGSSPPTQEGAPASRFELTQVPFSIVISAYGHAGRLLEADALFEYLQELAQQTDNPQLQPGWITWNSLLWAHAQDTNQGSAQDVLVRLFQAWDAGQVGSSSSSSWMHNPVEVWSGIMASWALSNHPQAPEFLERVLERLEQTVVPGKRPGLSTYLYNTLLTSYARQHSAAAAHKADALLQRMENSCVEHNPTNVPPLPPPDSNSYVNLLMAWINAGQPERSEECLKQLCRSQNHPSSHTDNKQGLLTAQHFNLVMDGWVKQSNRPDSLDRAMAVMKGMTERGFVPDSYTYTSLMWAWAKSPTVQDPAPPVEHLYRLMMSNAHQLLAKPGAVTYNALLHAWARSPDPAAPNRVQALWNEIKRSGVRRNAKLYNTLMSFWSRRNRPTETEAVFQELIQEYHAHDNDDHHHHQKDVLRPQGRSYNARLQVWSKAGHPEQTAKVLREWIAAYESGMVVDSLPSTKHFNAVLHAWLRSSDPQRASKAEAGLRQMSQLAHSNTSLSLSSTNRSSSKRRLECRPDHRSYGSVITAYANSSHLPESGEKAFQLWHELNERFPPRTRSAKGGTDDKDDLHSMLRIHGQVFVALCRSFGRVDNSVPPDSAACLLVQRLHQVLDHVPAVIHCDKTTTRHSLTQMKNALQSIVLDHVQQEGLLVKLESLENTTNKKKRGQG